MAAEQFFTRIANQVLEATERLSNHFDDNLSLLFGSSTGSTASTSNDNDNNGNIGAEKDQDAEDFMDGTYHDSNPLQGMAEQVLSGIMDGQVCTFQVIENTDTYFHHSETYSLRVAFVNIITDPCNNIRSTLFR
jgi:hypothetical protein